MLTAGESPFLIFVLAIFVLALIALLVVRILTSTSEFVEEMKNLNCEIKRTHGEDRKYWISRKRRLWLSLIPFVKY